MSRPVRQTKKSCEDCISDDNEDNIINNRTENHIPWFPKYLVKKIDGNTSQIDVSRLKKGVYFLSTKMNAEKNSVCFMKLWV